MEVFLGILNYQLLAKNYLFAAKDDYAGLSWGQAQTYLTGAFVANWSSSHLESSILIWGFEASFLWLLDIPRFCLILYEAWK